MKKLLSMLLALLMMCMVFSAHAESFESTIEWDAEYDVIVIGFGAAGATAAVTAAEEGAKVLLLEKAPEALAGGNSRVCMQWMGYVDPAQKEDAIAYMKALRGNFNTPSDVIIEMYVDGLSDNLAWMTDVLGMENPTNRGNVEFVNMPGAGSIQTMTGNGAFGGDGYMYFKMKASVEERADKIDVWYSAPAKHLIQDKATRIVHGVEAEVNGQKINIRAKNGVVLCCGGFESNEQMLQDYGVKAGLVSLGSAMFNTGDGIVMAQEVGANLWHMGNMVYADLDFRYDVGVQVFGTQRAPAKKGAIMIGGDGTRFMNEDDKSHHGKSYFHGDIIQTPFPSTIYMIVDQEIIDMGPLHNQFSADNSEEIASGWIVKGDTLAELAGKIGVPAANLEKTIALNNEMIDRGEDILFGRNVDTMKKYTDGPFYAIQMVASVVNTQGGPERNEHAEIIDLYGDPIPHLYGAGELGDIWSYCYQASCNIGGGMLFGREAGKNAAAAKSDNDPASVMEGKTPFVPEIKEVVYETEEGETIGYGQGMGGTKLVVKVKKTGEDIEYVKVINHSETPGITARALAKMPERIAEADTADVDTVAGATVTSKAIIAAVKDALD